MDPEARAFIFGRGGHLEFPFPVAVKTGTSQAYHDNWTIGYTRNVTVGVWVGNFDHTPLRASTGVTGAGPIFHAVMLAAERRTRAIGMPDALDASGPPAGTGQRDICALSGMIANAWCPTHQREWLPSGEDAACSWHHLSDEGLLVVWPPEYRVWARAHGLLDDRPRVSRLTTTPHTVATRAEPRIPLQIANPPAGAIYSIDPTLRREFQTLSLRVAAARWGRIQWHVDSQPVGTASSDATVTWPLAPGRHLVTARDAYGHSAEAAIIVR